MTQCTNCGATLEPGMTVCPACGTSQGAEAPAPAAAPAYAAPSGGLGSNLFNFARGAKGIALLCFVLPFVTVSCAGQTLVSMSGLDLATGSIAPPTMPGAAPGAGAAAPATSYGVDIFVLIAAVLIIAALVATFVLPRRKAALAAMGACALAAVLLFYDVFIRIPGKVEDQMESSGATGATPPAGAGAEYQQQLEQMQQAISVDPAIGFWLTLIALVAAIVLNKMVHGGRET